MPPSDSSDVQSRVLILAPTVRDAAICEELLTKAAIPSLVCQNLEEVCDEASRGAGSVLIAAEALRFGNSGPLVDMLQAQASWSDLPLLVLTPPGPESPSQVKTLENLGNVTLIKRPVQVTMLLSMVRAALRDRQRQYTVRTHLMERDAQANALMEADRRKNEFLAILAHELRNPLAPIRNGMALLRLTDAPDQREATLSMMDRQVTQMVRLINDLLDVSRITRSHIELKKQCIELRDVVRDALEICRDTIEAAGHSLSVALPPEPVFLEADPLRLSQVFANLLHNSAKYTEGKGAITLAAEVIGEAGQRQVSVTVSDTGIGIPASMLESVFDMFTQVDSTMDRSQGGLGIGLTLVKRLVEMHGGTVRASSEGLGKGSQFELRLPILGTVPCDSTEPHALVPTQCRRLRVLVADDNVDSVRTLALMLELLGHEIYVAHDGRQALERVEKHRPDLAILDIGMPELNGYDVAQRIRDQSWGRSMTLAALTGWGTEADKRRALEAGFDLHAVKPIAVDALQAMLHSASSVS